MPPQAQGTKLVKVEGQMVRVPVDATPDEIDQLVGGGIRPEARMPGAMQRKNPNPQPGERIGGPIFTASDIEKGTDARLKDAYRQWESTNVRPPELNTPEGRAYSQDRYMRESGSFAGGTAGGMAVSPLFAAAKALPWLSRILARSAVAGTGVGAGSIAGGASPKEGLQTGEATAVLEPGFAALGPIAKVVKKGLVGPSPNPPISASELFGAIPGMSRAGRLLGRFMEEPKEMPGAAREAAGGTAATTGPAGGSTDVALGSQAGPSGPKNAGELSATVQRIRGGQGPGTASNPTIYTPEQLASEQGMSTAALGKGGFNLTIPPEQQRIMQLVSEGRVPMGKPPAQGFESLGRPTPFEGAAPSTPASAPQPLSPLAQKLMQKGSPGPQDPLDKLLGPLPKKWFKP